MQAVALFPEGPDLRVIEKERPEPADGEVLIRTLSVGIDGSDRRIVDGEIGGDVPDGEDHLVVGHEAVGIVEDANGTELTEGTVVTPLVRRPTDAGSHAAQNGELDMAPAGAFHECGIFGAHGYMAEYVTCEPAYLVTVPASHAEYGFFVEPASILEKSLEQAFAARSGFNWRPESAFVLGNGNLGLLGLARLATGEEFERTYCLGRRDRPDPTIDFIERVGGTYVDSRETPLRQVPAAYEPVDYVFETTGYPKHSVGAARALGPNGVATLQGIPGEATFEFEGGAFHSDLVVNNKALLGVVNSRKTHFEAAVDWLSDVSSGLLDDLVTGRYSVDEIDRALDDSPETLKTVICFE
ncbi:alcohol dehydrogenase catalytic domain-containing protein [Haloarcula salina]|uniref:Glucose 1-dehydrogenase n=1 Tax=Haloarcula salina TaxID=1429914 RepID=A0AA41KJE8_9EURY|nr:alcohol dehydrogenase catalytic domain-containing protein [Haloarcula salina]MBV0902678.1 alcohol dehydrogenase catalytic domain-containing protein [Haloarcula salina]